MSASSPPADHGARLRKALLAIDKLRAELDRRDAPVAIVGIGCRFPGGADGPEPFWRILRDGIDAVGELPRHRWDPEAYYDADPSAPGKMISRRGALLEQIDGFDPGYFGISPREASRMDPQQRLLLEVAKEAFDDAGLPEHRLAGSPAGVFIGITESEYAWLHHANPAGVDSHTATGSYGGIAANRISYCFDLRGPSFTVDSICSSSLVALHLACESLRRDECGLALAGAACVLTGPDQMIWLSKLGVVSVDGRCKAFDARGDGIVLGEGVGLVVLKPLARALEDGDRIYAVIRGSAVAQDGRSNGLTAPSRRGQEAMLRQAYRRAGVPPHRVHYVEAHGTGTELGDPIEAAALGAVLGEGRAPDRPCYLGSVKTNLAHLGPVGGIASLLKVALALHHRELPASLHFEEPNPHIPFADLRLRVPTARMPWPYAPETALAGVTSLAFGGTNVHVVVEEAPQPQEPEAVAQGPAPQVSLLPLSAHSAPALAAMTVRYRDWIAERTDVPALDDLCRTAAVHRSHHAHRRAVLCSSPEELAEVLDAALRGESRPGLSSGQRPPDGRRKLAFLFPGQGSQYAGMGRELLEREPVFRAAIERCDEAVRRWADRSVLEEIHGGGGSDLDRIDVVQPVLFSLQFALAALWRSWGVEPDAVAGQSLGEVAAACVAGALSLDEAARVICRRSRLLRRISGRGAMAVVELSLEQARQVLAGHGDRLSVAVSSGPRSTVLSGDPAALEEVLEELERSQVFCRRIKVDVASHSPQVDGLRDDLLAELEGLRPGPLAVPLCSTVTAEFLSGEELGPGYWVRNLREPVLLGAGLARLAQSGCSVFLEVSPHPVLTPVVEECLRDLGQDGVALSSLRRDEGERRALLSNLGALYSLGEKVKWEALYPAGRHVRLPTYPWQRERLWLDAPVDGGERSAHRSRGKGNPLLGERLDLAMPPGRSVWSLCFDPERTPWLIDHCGRETPVLPAAAYLDLALAAAMEVAGGGVWRIEGVRFRRLLDLTRAPEVEAQLALSPEPGGGFSFAVRSRRAGEPSGSSWAENATGILRTAGGEETAATDERVEQILGRCPDGIAGAELYRRLAARGLSYGPHFRLLEEVWRGSGEALGRLRLEVRSNGRHACNPVLLDAALQVSFAALAGEEGGLWSPVGLDRLAVFGVRRSGGSLWSHARLRRPPEEGSVELDVRLLDDEGRVLLEALGLRLERLGGARGAARDHLLEVRWEAAPLTPGPDPDVRGTWLLLADRSGVAAGLRRHLEANGARCVTVIAGEGGAPGLDGADHCIDPGCPESFGRLLERMLRESTTCRGVVHLWGLDDREEPDLAAPARSERGCVAVLHLVQALATLAPPDACRLWLVTAGAQAVMAGERVSVVQAPLWGLGKAIALEHPALGCTRIDFDRESGPEAAGRLGRELAAGAREPEIAWRGERRLVARLVRRVATDAAGPLALHAGKRPFRLELPEPGSIDRIAAREAGRRPPGPGEVEIRVTAAGLNFMDIVRAQGLFPLPEAEPGPLRFGMECAGEIAALGAGVEGLAVGQSVLAVVPAPSCLGTHVVTPACLAVPLPAGLDACRAASVPIAFLTASRALLDLARLQKGERVLIHSAAGGVGLAAVQIARRLGAEVFATAGSDEKRRFLRSLGVEHVHDSRSLRFATEVMEGSGGRGVDVVLSSLAGEAAERSLALLAPFGRFVEIGKRDIYEEGHLDLRPFAGSLAYFALDLALLLKRRPEVAGALLREIVARMADGTYEPLPSRIFPASAAREAFLCMARAEHIGKLVVSFAAVEDLPLLPAAGEALRADGTYLLSGGLGGLGLTFARWAVERGARHLVLLGRSAPSAAAREAIRDLERAGARVTVAATDVARRDEVGRVLAEIETALPPLRGVFHAAAAGDDGLLVDLSAGRVREVLAPKVDGAWNLHELTRERELDFFVLFSSTASLLGSPGQGSYCAANAFLDALAHHRRARGLPALSVHWGPWAEVGGAARLGLEQRFAARGLRPITPQEGVAGLAALLADGAVEAAVARFDPELWQRFHPQAAPFLSSLARPGGTCEAAPGSLRASLLAQRGEEDAPEPVHALDLHLRGQMAEVLGLRVAGVDLRRASLRDLGFDSLMALELRNRLERSLELTLPATLVWTYPTFDALLSHLATRLGIEAVGPAAPAPGGESGEEEALRTIAALSEEAAAERLLRRLEFLE